VNILRILPISFFLALLAASGTEARCATRQETVTRATLSNGMHVVIVENHLAPVVTVQANVLAGGSESSSRFPGMAHAQEHMAFRGCTDMTADQTAAIYAQLGDDNNAETQQEVTQFYATVPAADMEVALAAQAKCLQGINDSQAEWKRERGAIEQELAEDLSDPTYEVLRRINLTIFTGTPYAQDALGTRASYERMTGAMLRAFYRKWYTPSNVVLVVVGDIDRARALAKVVELFGDIHSHKLPPRPGISLRPFKSLSFALKSNLPYTLGFIAYRLPGSDSPDYAATVVLADALASQRAEIYGMIPAGLALHANFGLEEIYRKASLGLAVVAVPSNGSLAVSCEKLRQILHNYARNGIPEELVETAKRRELAQRFFQLNSISGLADAWSNAVAAEGRLSPEDDFEAIRKVTGAEVNRVARQYLLNADTVTASLKPASSQSLESFEDVGDSERLDSTALKPVTLPLWASRRLERLEIPDNHTQISDVVLANGIRLIVRTDSTNPTITLLGSVKHSAEMQTPAGQEGISDILDAIYSYGSRRMDRLALQKALDDISADESAGYQFSLNVLRNDFARGVQLLAENELDPALNEIYFTRVKQQSMQRIVGNSRSSDYRSARVLDLAMVPQGDPALRNATLATVSAITLSDVVAYQKATIRPDMTTIVVVGDILPGDAESVIDKWFGGWTAQGPKPETGLPPVPLNRASSTTIFDSTLDQDEVVLTEQLKLDRLGSEYYSLQLGAQVLDGGFYAARLYRDLRQDLGYVYTVDVSLAVSGARASYTVVYGCAPGNVNKVRAIILRDLNQMRTENITASELHQAKALLLRQVLLEESSDDEIAAGILNRAENQLPLDEPYQAARKFMELRVEDVRDAFARLVRIEDLVQVVQGPARGARYSKTQTLAQSSPRGHHSAEPMHDNSGGTLSASSQQRRQIRLTAIR
jgi:zinc protease